MSQCFPFLYLKENAHFSISEALIAAIEQMKWNHIIAPTDIHREEREEEESDEEIKELRQRIRIRKREKLKEVIIEELCVTVSFYSVVTYLCHAVLGSY